MSHDEPGNVGPGGAPDPIVIHPQSHGEADAVTVPANKLIDRRRKNLPPEIAELFADVESRPEPPRHQPPQGTVSPAPPELAAAVPKRAYALDALRGLFLLSMTFGFSLPTQGLPIWMYHRQFPPPSGELANIAGISWRDLAYGAFLFTMSAALPLTISRRIDKGETEIAIVVAAIRRYVVLVFFALLIGHSNTFFLGYTESARVLAIIGFVIMALVFTRRRSDWSESRYRLVNRAGWLLAIVFLALSPLAYGKTFSFQRNDDIIVGLAFASLVGSVLWYFTRDNLPARLGVLGAAIALFLGAKGGGWVNDWWWNSPVAWAFQPSMFVLLTIVVPGLVAGDVLLRWMRDSLETGGGERGRWGGGRTLALIATTIAVVPVIVVGLYQRELAITTGASAALVIMGLFITWGAGSPTERMLASLFRWGGAWLMIGLFLEPFEGGIHKVPDTLTYFFTIAGVTLMMLVAFAAFIDKLAWRRPVNALIDIGHN
ncbi:MAG: DUF5009 domain-containing protein, partial [Gemmatimonadaceae bacterium]|nr:DUF5009 domain-containing protein [Gemmatimonadaceae bacterium]